MDWIELEQKHKKEWEKFEEFKKDALEKIDKAKREMYAAFGDHEAKIPMSVFERVRQDRDQWQEAWGDNGFKAKYLLAIHDNERKALKQQVKNKTLEYMRQGKEKQKQLTKGRERDD
ncbi:hypothetical protein [Niabella hibiscisoli]|uniref:hypothetical protein n=1 Tax=Niabella hibiscisoli TaxID=1825928 RepID=UPI001F10B810|nr:hypothetical protein [Niabella hibiscisoli]MCH5716713.1 hypothetical protein [Niabella hibiscisoli]